MSEHTAKPETTPDRDDVLPETYAVYVDEQYIHAFQYRINISEPDGEWYHVETLDRENDPRLTVEHARPMPPASDGYWLYTKSYDCEMERA